MDNTQLVGLSRQAVLRRQIDVIANNLANVNTAGYRAEHMRFAEHTMPGATMNGLSGEDAALSYVRDAGALNDMKPGAVRHTGNALDLAIDGRGWFVIETPDGTRYSRNGAFRLDAGGNLVTANGHFVQGQSGNVTFSPTEREIAIAADGTISSSEGTKGRLRIVQFENDDTLQREGESMFIGEEPQPVDTPNVVQGALEQSNVQAIREIADMVRVTRAYTNLSRLFSDNSEMQTDAINKLGQLNS
jgi:flagellar basal-body rod protein FlgF